MPDNVNMSNIVSLNTLRKNESGIIKQISVDVPTKMYDFDFQENQEITLLQKSPFMGPILFKIGAIKVAIRYQDAQLIEVEKI